MKTSRHRILEYISKKRRVTTIELSRVFQMSQANARHHLAILEEQGLIEGFDHKLDGRKGRPARIFSPSRNATGQNLDILASALLNLLKESENHPEFEIRLEKLARSMFELIEEPDSKSSQSYSPIGSMTNHLNRLTKHLNNCHYMSRWEARPSSPHLIFENCPYLAIINEYPELCKVDTLIIGNFLNKSIVQIQKLALDSSGLQVCRFSIGNQRV
jgi:predicted ArsR family transcriptional regulator